MIVVKEFLNKWLKIIFISNANFENTKIEPNSPTTKDLSHFINDTDTVFKAICADSPESIKQISYERLYQLPTLLFPNWDFAMDSSGCMEEFVNRLKSEQRALRKNLTILRQVSLEMENVLKGDLRGFTNLAILINSTVPKYVFIGSQSSGKSHILNILSSLTLSPIHVALRNKSPIIFKIWPVRRESQSFAIDGVTMPYENLLPSLVGKFNQQLELSDNEILVEINASFIFYPMDFVTLPEYEVSKRADLILISQIIQKYLTDPSKIFIVIIDPFNETELESDYIMHTLGELTDDSKLVFIINYLNFLNNKENPPLDVVTKIKSIVDTWKCSENNLPYLVCMPRVEEKSILKSKSTSKEQFRFWADFANKSDNLSQKLNNSLNPWRIYFPNGYPWNRIGINSLKNNIAVSLTSSFQNRLRTFISNEKRIIEAKNQIKVQNLSKLVKDFIFEFVLLLKGLADDPSKVWNRILLLKGTNFSERIETDGTHGMFLNRTRECINYLQVENGIFDELSITPRYSNSFHSIPIDRTKFILREAIPKNKFQNHISLLGESLIEFAIKKINRNMMYSFYEFNDFEINNLILNKKCYSKLCDDVISSLAISTITNNIFSLATIKRQVFGLQCNLIRIARACLYILIVERNPTDPIRILASNPFIQNILTKKFENHLQNILHRSSRIITDLVTRIMLSSKLSFDLLHDKDTLQETYNDLRTSWSEISTKPLCYPQTIDDEASFQVNAPPEFYESVRNKTKIHYSDRLLLLTTLIINEHNETWRDFKEFELRNALEFTDEEISYILNSEIGHSFTVASELMFENKKIVDELQILIEQILYKESKTIMELKAFDPFQKFFFNSS